MFFITANFPEPGRHEEIVLALAESGCDILELGVPFSDPIADGPTIQRSSQRVLAQGATLKGIIDLAARLRQRIHIPIVLFSALNPLLKFGLGNVVARAREVGIDGFLCPDLPPEEADDLIRLCKERDLSLVFLVTPTTLHDRKKWIADHSTGFIYYVSLRGVTGARDKLSIDIAEQVKEIKSLTNKPVVVGFGISKPEHVRMVAGSGADGAVIGSALINLIEENETSDRLIPLVREYVENLRRALDEPI